MNFKFEGIFAKEFIIFHIVTKPCTAPQLQAKSPPALKNIIYTLGVKSISKMRFSCCMRNTKKSVSHGAWEAQFRLLQPLRSKTNTFFLAKSPQRGVKNGKIWFSRCMRNKKKMFLAEHEKHDFDFCNPSRMILKLLAGFGRFWPVLAGSGRLWPVLAGSGRFSCRFVTFRSKFHPH